MQLRADITNKERKAARILLVDPQDRVLLLSSWFEQKGCLIWVAPGGALEEGETFEEAARRECWEEIGLRWDGELPHVWVREHKWMWGERAVHTIEHYFFARVEHFEPQAQELEDYEEELFRGHRWCGVAELGECEGLVVPRALGELLEPLIAGEVPGEALVVGV